MGISDEDYARQLEKLKKESAVVHAQQQTFQATNINTGASAKASPPLKTSG